MALWRQVACWISNATRAQANARARAPPTHTPARARAQKYVLSIVFPRQQWFRESDSLLRCKYIAAVLFTPRTQMAG